MKQINQFHYKKTDSIIPQWLRGSDEGTLHKYIKVHKDETDEGGRKEPCPW